MSHNKPFNHTILPYIYILVMAFATWTWLFHFSFINITWFWLSMGCVVSFIVIRKYYWSKLFYALAVYALIVIANVFTGDFYFNKLPMAFNEIAGLIFVSSATMFFLNETSNKTYRLFVAVFFFIIVYTAVVSYQINLVLPGAIRNITVTGFGGDSTYVSLYYAMGMGTYFMTHALPVIIPPLVMGIRYLKISLFKRCLLIVVLIATVVYVYLGYASGALIIGLLSLFLSLLVKPGPVKENIGKIIIMSVFLLPFLSDDVLLFFLDKFEELIGGEGAYMVKVEEFRMLILEGKQGDDISSRMVLYSNSIMNFIGNGIWGTNGEIGGHSAILDRFATLGLIGIIPFLYFLAKQIKYPVRFINPNYLLYYYIGVFAGVLMLLTKNMGNWEMWLCLFMILPMLMVRLAPKKSDVPSRQSNIISV